MFWKAKRLLYFCRNFLFSGGSLVFSRATTTQGWTAQPMEWPTARLWSLTVGKCPFFNGGPRVWAKPETKNWYHFKNFLIYVRLPLFEYCSIGPSLLSLSALKNILHGQWEFLSLTKYPTLSEIYIQAIGRHYRLDRIFFLVPNFLFLVIEINEQEFKIDGQNFDNSEHILK